MMSNPFYPPQNDATKKSSPFETEAPIFNLFGISLHFDDLLLLGLIYFLYTEDNKDQELLMCLLLLLLS